MQSEMVLADGRSWKGLRQGAHAFSSLSPVVFQLQSVETVDLVCTPFSCFQQQLQLSDKIP
jgi:hypothetical protein